MRIIDWSSNVCPSELNAFSPPRRRSGSLLFWGQPDLRGLNRTWRNGRRPPNAWQGTCGKIDGTGHPDDDRYESLKRCSLPVRRSTQTGSVSTSLDTNGIQLSQNALAYGGTDLQPRFVDRKSTRMKSSH